MTTTFTHPLIPTEQNEAGPNNLLSLLLEPIFIAAACLFWLAVLPITGVFCAAVAVYDKITALKTQPLRLPDLRANLAHNPLVLRKKSLPGQKSIGHTRGTSQALQS